MTLVKLFFHLLFSVLFVGGMFIFVLPFLFTLECISAKILVVLLFIATLMIAYKFLLIIKQDIHNI
jgi:hypothetical protein